MKSHIDKIQREYSIQQRLDRFSDIFAEKSNSDRNKLGQED